MTGGRTRRLLREEAKQRFHPLGQFLGGYLHEDWPKLHGTPEQAVDTAIQKYPIELRQEIQLKLHALLVGMTDDWELRDVLNRALGVKVYFKTPAAARAFAVDVEAKLMASIREHFRLPSEG